MQGSFGLWSLGTRSRRPSGFPRVTSVNKAMAWLKCYTIARVASRGKLCIENVEPECNRILSVQEFVQFNLDLRK